MIFAAKKRKNRNMGLTYFAVCFAQITDGFVRFGEKSHEMDIMHHFIHEILVVIVNHC